jgi:hypothetical protein
MKKYNQQPLQSDIIFYSTPSGDVQVEVLFKNENVWLTQKLIAKLFDIDRSVITKHLKNIFNEGELVKRSVSAKIAHTAKDGKKYKTLFYNLDAIISVGYRVNSQKATHFRIWATKTLKEFIIKGFVIDDKRLKQGMHFGKDYFDELLEKIREIRASERRFYQKITDIYSLSVDYDKNAPITKNFFATVQNKLHWAITGKTAAEIIYSKACSKKLFMGLKTWKNAPRGKILRSDALIAKNYLNKKHIKELELIVSAYLDLAENRAKRKILMKMNDWINFLDRFLELSDYPILLDKGKVSKLKAKLKAEQEYGKFRVSQDKTFKSDFDREVQKYLKFSNNKENNKKGFNKKNL